MRKLRRTIKQWPTFSKLKTINPKLWGKGVPNAVSMVNALGNHAKLFGDSWDKTMHRFRKLEREASKTKGIKFKQGIWTGGKDSRGLREYSKVFLDSLNYFLNSNETNLASALAKFSQGGTLRYLEEGPGRGVFLREFWQELKKLGIDLHATTVSLKKAPEINELKKLGVIKRASEMPSEHFITKQKFDVIISMQASFTHSPYYTFNYLMRKYSSRLRRGGIMLIGFNRHASFADEFKKEFEPSLKQRGYKVQLERVLDSEDAKYVLIIQKSWKK